MRIVVSGGGLPLSNETCFLQLVTLYARIKIILKISNVQEAELVTHVSGILLLLSAITITKKTFTTHFLQECSLEAAIILKWFAVGGSSAAAGMNDEV